MGGHDQVRPGGQGDVGEDALDAAGEAPAVQVHGVGAAIVKLDVLLEDILALRMVHDLVQDDVGRKGRGGTEEERNGNNGGAQVLHDFGLYCQFWFTSEIQTANSRSALI